MPAEPPDARPPSADPSAAEDVDWMLRAAKDDAAAFSALVEKHRRPLMNYFSRCGVESDVEDLAQLTFLKLHRTRHGYRPTAKFTTFLYLLARQVLLDSVRAARRRAALHERAGREMEPASPPPRARGEREDARYALSRLSPGLRDAAVLVLMQGLAYHEAAVVLGVPTGTVKSRVHAALVQMRAALTSPPPSSAP